MGEFKKIILYAKKVNFTPDYAFLLSTILRVNPEKGAEFAGMLANDESGPLLDLESVRIAASGFACRAHALAKY